MIDPIERIFDDKRLNAIVSIEELLEFFQSQKTAFAYLGWNVDEIEQKIKDALHQLNNI